LFVERNFQHGGVSVVLERAVYAVEQTHPLCPVLVGRDIVHVVVAEREVGGALNEHGFAKRMERTSRASFQVRSPSPSRSPSVLPPFLRSSVLPSSRSPSVLPPILPPSSLPSSLRSTFRPPSVPPFSLPALTCPVSIVLPASMVELAVDQGNVDGMVRIGQILGVDHEGTVDDDTKRESMS